jgi:tetratricopeptide (TPR) repeat protein
MGRWRVGTITAAIFCVALAWSSLVYGEERAAEDPPRRPPEQEKKIDQLRHEAEETLLHGQFDRARREFEEVLALVPNDASAQRDAARAAQAAGEFEYAAAALERAHHFGDHKRDPEVHYLRGEALFTLDRPDEARREHRLAELEIGDHPKDRMEKLWLARIYARRRWVVLADRLYEPMWPAPPAKDAEVALNQADGHLMNEDWAGGEKVLRRFLALEPDNVRAREMLAWALEASGKIDDEMVVRRSLAQDQPTTTNRYDYGRALERAAEFRDARDQYGAALATGGNRDPDQTVLGSWERMQYRTTLELSGGAEYRADPQAWAWRLQAGAAKPFGQRQQLSLLAWHDAATDWTANLPNATGDSTLRGTGSVTGLSGSAVVASRSMVSLLVGADVRFSQNRVADNHNIVYRQASGLQAGAVSEVDAPLFPFASINVNAFIHEQWADAPITIHEGGVMSGATAHLYLRPPSQIVLVDAGLQIRRLSIDPQEQGGVPPAEWQRLFWAGIDFNLWTGPKHVVRGESLDERMVRRTYLTDAGILAYRHYELFTSIDPDFRIALAPRSSIDNGTLTVRKVLPGGRVGFDVHGGLGYDNQRVKVLAQGGGSLVVAVGWSSRLLASYDLQHETAIGIPGNLHIGWLTYHADF